MKTTEIVISNNGAGMEAALDQADRTAREMGLSPRDAIRMRLLVEEMMSLMRSITGHLDGKFCIETTDDGYHLHMRTETLLDGAQRKQLLSASTSGRNEAHRGLMGKIRAFFEPMPIDDTPAYLANTIVTGSNGEDITWSMDAYRERLRGSKDASSEAREEWDELEKSVVSHIADNIEVSIHGYEVRLKIDKKLR